MEEFISEKDIAVLILASGNSVRIGGVTKQLLELGLTTILERIITQVETRGHNPIVVTHNEEIHEYLNSLHKDYFVPDAHSATCETLLSAQTLWNKRTIVLLGDVIYSNAVMDEIFDVATKTQMVTQVFGDMWEIYALILVLDSFNNDRYGYERIVSSLERAKTYQGGKLRYFYRLFAGFDIDKDDVYEGESKEKLIFRYVRDWTRDIDMMSQYNNALTELVATGLLNKK